MAHLTAPTLRHDGTTGLRSRDLTGRLRLKRGDTFIGTTEQHYGVDFHCRSDMRLATLRKEVGLVGIKELVGAARAGAK